MKKRRDYIYKYSDNDYAVYFDKSNIKSKHFKTERGAVNYLNRKVEEYRKKTDIMYLLGYRK